MDMHFFVSILSSSAGACPLRAFDRPKHGEGQAPALREKGAFLSQANITHTVARGPVPRDAKINPNMASGFPREAFGYREPSSPL